MKQMISRIRKSVAAVLLLMLAIPVWSANTKTTIEQVTTAVTLADDVDYIITSSTPFSGQGIVDITNTEHAVVILSAVKPSKAISSWLKNITINGKKAVNNNNCMVKLYNRGCIILPYSGGDRFKPLTVYSEKNFEGESCDDFGLEHSGGYMNTLTEEKLNNRISSFKLKRGYMVTFSIKAGGRGYSRCFIAADKDLEIASLPGILDNSISSYRVFKWYDTGKKNIANDTRSNVLAALNVQSSYDWGQGNSSLLPDYEWVPNHIYEDWPSSSTIGSTTQSPHTKNNNEPRNSSDDHPQDLATILGNWENMMRTGLRLCSPASWDGSDYWNATGFLAEFLDSIDARGWRCDIIDLHCYWTEGSFGNMHYWSDKYKRPIWISEWCWGASWNKNGAFASGVTQTDVRNALEKICTNLNNWDFVERYYYWNGEAAISKIYNNGLTPAGQYYAAMDAGVGYNGKYDFVPKTPKQYDPTGLTCKFNNKTNSALLSWKDFNGEMNASMSVQRRAGNGSAWETIADIDLQESEAEYNFEDKDAFSGCQYRILVVDAANKERYTQIVSAASSDLQAGDEIDIDGTTKYVGGNIILNGNFDMEAFGWTTGTGTVPAAPYFQVVKAGGYDEGTYLQAYGNGAITSVQAINTSFDIKANTEYYFSTASCNMPSGYSNSLGLSQEDKTSVSARVYINNTTANWNMQFGHFNSNAFTQARVRLAGLGAKAQVDKMMLCQLFSTKDSAIADGVEKMKLKAGLFLQFNTKEAEKYVGLNTELAQVVASVTTTNQEALTTLTEAVDNAILAYKLLESNERFDIIGYAEKLTALNLHGVDELKTKLEAAKQATGATAIVGTYIALNDYFEEYLPQTDVNGKIQNPSFAKTTGWTTKCGTYTGGDQKVATSDGVTFWNAWWSGIDATDETKTMAIKQTVTNLPHGLYALECKAATEHYCLSDQHGYITSDTLTESTGLLAADFYDLPSVSKEDRWQSLISAPIYVDENGSVTIGFESSKKGSLSGAWLERGKTTSQTNDKREGWWGATDFVLKHSPLYKLNVVPEQWGTICLPYAIRPTENLKFYQIAGINPEYTQLCLVEVNQLEAGMPYIYRSTVAETQFLEYGEAVTSAVAADEEVCNLRGFLKSTATVPQNYFYVKDGIFEKAVSDRPKIASFSGLLRPFSDNRAQGIPVLESWTGETMPINGVTDEDKAGNEGKVASGIQFTTRVAPMAEDGIYTIDGRHVSLGVLKPGLYIKVVGGRAYKTIVK